VLHGALTQPFDPFRLRALVDPSHARQNLHVEGYFDDGQDGLSDDVKQRFGEDHEVHAGFELVQVSHVYSVVFGHFEQLREFVKQVQTLVFVLRELLRYLPAQLDLVL